MRILRFSIAPLLIAILSACSEVPAALRSSGTAADAIAGLFWFFTIVTAAAWLLVVLALVMALVRRRSLDARDIELAPPNGRGNAIASWIVTIASAVTAIILVVLTIESFWTGKSLADLARDPPLTIEVTGWQWWWDVTYEDPDASRTLTTANEIHVPVGRPVRLKLSAGDVIHSFWVPELAGKEDLIPGHQNYLTLIANTPGVYRGQCAEFCGLQHAHMGLRVIVEPADVFAAWYARELKAAAEPSNDEARRGRQVFMSQPCVMCHAIRGTQAGGRAGPDLTHVASRLTIAAGTLPTTRGSLAAWIADPQSTKPGTKMPLTGLSADDLNAVVAYLEGLK